MDPVLGVVIFPLFIFVLIFVLGGIATTIKSEDEWERYKETVAKTYLLDSVTKERASGSSAFARGLIGGAIGGDLGAIAGVASAKTKTDTIYTFLVFYKDGTKDTRDCYKGSREWNLFIEHLEI